MTSRKHYRYSSALACASSSWVVHAGRHRRRPSHTAPAQQPWGVTSTGMRRTVQGRRCWGGTADEWAAGCVASRGDGACDLGETRKRPWRGGMRRTFFRERMAGLLY